MESRHLFATKPDSYRVGPKGVDSGLDKALAAFARDGARVLDFWRSGGRWVFKLMAPRRG